MDMDEENFLVVKKVIFTSFIVVVALIIGIYGIGFFDKIYEVWAHRKVGEAELAHAEYNRQIKIYEAKAFEEGAHHFANAEIARAEGVAKANQIIGDSLKNNEVYLRYLWITSLKSKNKEIIYIPTEGNIPILEAGKR